MLANNSLDLCLLGKGSLSILLDMQGSHVVKTMFMFGINPILIIIFILFLMCHNLICHI